MLCVLQRGPSEEQVLRPEWPARIKRQTLKTSVSKLDPISHI